MRKIVYFEYITKFEEQVFQPMDSIDFSKYSMTLLVSMVLHNKSKKCITGKKI